MVNKVDPLTLLEAGLKAASMRQAAIANNIANIQTPGFRRSDVNFADALQEALRSGKTALQDLNVQMFQPLSTDVDTSGNDVSLDMEIGELMKNDGAAKTYLRMIGKLYRQMDTAIGG